LNRAFASFDEMRMVKGMDDLELIHPAWRDAFTLWTFGQVDLNEAAPDVIAAATGVRLAAAVRVWDTLAGRDGVRFTSDDLRFASVEEAMKKLGIGGKPSPLFGIEGKTRHVESIGKAGDFQCRLVMVLSGAVPIHREEMPMTLDPIQFAKLTPPPKIAHYQLLFPGPEGWELWTFDENGTPAAPQSKGLAPGFEGAASSRILALPVASTYSIPLWVFGQNDAELRGAAHLHLEKDGLIRPEEPSGFDLERILTRGQACAHPG